MVSDEATQDPLDVAILDKARQSHLEANHKDSREQFIPFEPATKRAEAVYREDGHLLRVLKGAPQVISLLDENPTKTYPRRLKSLLQKD